MEAHLWFNKRALLLVTALILLLQGSSTFHTSLSILAYSMIHSSETEKDVTTLNEMNDEMEKEVLFLPHLYRFKVAVVGSGNFGTAVAQRVALNAMENTMIDPTVKMWVFEEVYEGRNLSEIINNDHMNPKYLPGIALPTNVIAISDLHETCRDADVLLFVLPHQFLPHVLKELKGVTKQNIIAVSLIKGLKFTTKGPVLLSEMIMKELGLSTCAVLMGANVASEVARGDFVESTVACDDKRVAKIVQNIFNSKQFRVDCCTDVVTVELCAALKNVVAMAAGFCDGMNQGASTKAAVIRQGLFEMAEFSKLFGQSFDVSTLFRSCGVADLIATCFGGRNRLCAEEFIHRLKNHAPTGRSSKDDDALEKLWCDIEKDLLHGQKLQGLDTTDEVISCLKFKGFYDSNNKSNGSNSNKFPLFKRIYAIARLGEKPETLFDWE
jgi:glycerol-3-phosphate dehydrogenase (NAD+)